MEPEVWAVVLVAVLGFAATIWTQWRADLRSQADREADRMGEQFRRLEDRAAEGDRRRTDMAAVEAVHRQDIDERRYDERRTAHARMVRSLDDVRVHADAFLKEAESADVHEDMAGAKTAKSAGPAKRTRTTKSAERATGRAAEQTGGSPASTRGEPIVSVELMAELRDALVLVELVGSAESVRRAGQAVGAALDVDDVRLAGTVGDLRVQRDRLDSAVEAYRAAARVDLGVDDPET